WLYYLGFCCTPANDASLGIWKTLRRSLGSKTLTVSVSSVAISICDTGNLCLTISIQRIPSDKKALCFIAKIALIKASFGSSEPNDSFALSMVNPWVDKLKFETRTLKN